jgi:hypothetical protein
MPNQSQPNNNPDSNPNNPNNQIKIKTCPYCNSDDLLVISVPKTGAGFVECQNCKATGPKVEVGQELAAWNEREGEETLVRIIYVTPKGLIS